MVISRFQTKRNGHSLIELVVSMLLASIVITNVYFFWKQMNKHIYHHQNHALLQKETDRVIRQVTSTIRRASQIIAFDRSSIFFLTDRSDDTLCYLFKDGELLQNNKPITILMNRTNVQNFEIKDLYEDPQNSSSYIFLEFALTLESHNGDTSAAQMRVKAKYPELKETDRILNW